MGDPEDIALEFARYLADAADAYLDFMGSQESEVDIDARSDLFRGLRSAAYEFRKRAPFSAEQVAGKVPGTPNTLSVEPEGWREALETVSAALHNAVLTITLQLSPDHEDAIAGARALGVAERIRKGEGT